MQPLQSSGGVPKTRTINNYSLSANISLTSGDFSSATLDQGTKADSAVQEIKVDGSLIQPDSQNVVSISSGGRDLSLFGEYFFRLDFPRWQRDDS